MITNDAVRGWPGFADYPIPEGSLEQAGRLLNSAKRAAGGGGWGFDDSYDPPPFRTELAIGFPSIPGLRSAPKQFSISLRHLLPNTLAPSGWRNAAPALGLAAFSGWAAFVAGITVLAIEPLRYEEACLLHKAWDIAQFDKTFSLPQMIAERDALMRDYGISLTESQIESGLAALERIGSLEPTPRGYRVAEKILLRPEP